jgi:hypothetical protein
LIDTEGKKKGTDLKEESARSSTFHVPKALDHLCAALAQQHIFAFIFSIHPYFAAF